MIKPNVSLKKKASAKRVQHITIDGIPIELNFKKVTKGRLSVDDKGGVRLTVPDHVELSLLKEIIYSKIDWLKSHREKALKNRPMERKFVNGEFVCLFGKKHDCFILQSKINGITKEGDAVFMHFKPNASPKKKAKLLREFYKAQLSDCISERLKFWQEKTGLSCSQWRIRFMKSCWGSCNPESGLLLFNLNLAKKSIECIDYIIVHELGHFVSRLHDKKFKQFLDVYLPLWRQTRRNLNNKSLDYAD